MNGYMTVQTGDGPQARYELGDAAFLMEGGEYEPFELKTTSSHLAGASEAPRLVVEGTTNRPGHQFTYYVELAYKPEELHQGKVYGFRYVRGSVRLLNPGPGQEDYVIEPKWLDEILDVFRKDERSFIKHCETVARFRATVERAVVTGRARRAGDV